MKRWWKRAGMLLALLVIIYVGVKPDILIGKPGIKAESAVLMDLNTGKILMDYNGSIEMAPAGISKLMTELLVMEAVVNGEARWDDAVNVSLYASSVGALSLHLSKGRNLQYRSFSRRWRCIPLMMQLSRLQSILVVQSSRLYR